VSTANFVPETWELTGDAARETLVSTGQRRLAQDAVMRLRASDGFSHARSLAFMLSLVLVQGIVTMVGLAQAFGSETLGDVLERLTEGLGSDGMSQVLVETIDNAQDMGSSQRYLPLVLGLVGSLITATTGMAQLERALNRLYGLEKDRPFLHRYGLALLLAASVGLLLTLAVVAITVGTQVGDTLDNDTLSAVWSLVRLPLALVLLVVSIGLLFHWCPRRHQPEFSWMAFGSVVSVLGVFLVTVGLAVFLRLSGTFGETYGPLAGMVAVLLWAMLSSIALLFGAAMAAQLEAVRAGTPEPQNQVKVNRAEDLAAERDALLSGAK
jgi:YihY family inner membrane protein